MFSLSYLRGQSGLVYLLVFPVLFFGRAGTVLDEERSPHALHVLEAVEHVRDEVRLPLFHAPAAHGRRPSGEESS